jgi:hypothetical protein
MEKAFSGSQSTWFFAFAIFFSTYSWAASSPCSMCDQIDSVTKILQTLNFSNPDEASKGEHEVQALAVPLLQKFDRISKKDPNRIMIFNSLLALTQVAQLYDGEGQLTNALVTKIQSEPTLKVAYAKYANGLPTSPGIQGYCTAQLLQIAVNTDICHINAGVIGQDTTSSQQTSNVERCIQLSNTKFAGFDFASCGSNASPR